MGIVHEKDGGREKIIWLLKEVTEGLETERYRLSGTQYMNSSEKRCGENCQLERSLTITFVEVQQ